jgi:hypothetical protein
MIAIMQSVAEIISRAPANLMWSFIVEEGLVLGRK